ncbi:MAG: double zinc ribbon domain-containing protein [Treponema sp.]|uniref:double zinc ribbon domain-containing protein n=1 Tax=Treponema sp. TaxID=166 RepID=UPI003FA30316
MNHKHGGPKFFCEFCNTEVPLNARLCPKCGRFFASVHCPNCGHTGEHSIFKKGCPKCGYAMKTADEDDHAAHVCVKHKPKKKDDPLPVWIYAAILLLLLIVLKVLYDYLH